LDRNTFSIVENRLPFDSNEEMVPHVYDKGKRIWLNVWISILKYAYNGLIVLYRLQKTYTR